MILRKLGLVCQGGRGTLSERALRGGTVTVLDPPSIIADAVCLLLRSAGTQLQPLQARPAVGSSRSLTWHGSELQAVPWLVDPRRSMSDTENESLLGRIRGAPPELVRPRVDGRELSSLHLKGLPELLTEA